MCVALKVARKWMTPRISLGSASSVIVDSEEGFCALVQANDLWVGSGEFLEPGWKSEVVRKVIRGSSLKVENVRRGWSRGNGWISVQVEDVVEARPILCLRVASR